MIHLNKLTSSLPSWWCCDDQGSSTCLVVVLTSFGCVYKKAAHQGVMRSPWLWCSLIAGSRSFSVVLMHVFIGVALFSGAWVRSGCCAHHRHVGARASPWWGSHSLPQCLYIFWVAVLTESCIRWLQCDQKSLAMPGIQMAELSCTNSRPIRIIPSACSNTRDWTCSICLQRQML